jgi:sporulation protein YlmC with PRC-barrel domain
MRTSDLLGARVCGPDGTDLGTVTDLRMVQDGPILGTWGAAFRLTGLVVSHRGAGSFLGYERGSVRGPWLVATIVKWLHRDAVLVPWDDVESWADRCVRVRRRKAELPPVPPLD